MHRRPMLLARVAVAGIAVAAAVALAAPTDAAASSPCGHVRRAPSWRHIVVIAFENHSYKDILGRSAPSSYMKMLAQKCGSAVDYRAVHFPRSLPDYLGATGGRIVTTADCLPGPGCRSGLGNIFSQLGGATGASSASRCRGRATGATPGSTSRGTRRRSTTPGFHRRCAARMSCRYRRTRSS